MEADVPFYQRQFLTAMKKANNRALLEAVLVTIMGYALQGKDGEWIMEYFNTITKQLYGDK